MRRLCGKKYFTLPAIFLGLLFYSGESAADPTRYPQFAQQNLPKGVVLEFIKLNQLVDEIVNRKGPLIVDVRSRKEFQEAHIKASISIPLGEIPLHLAEIPKDRLVVLY
ncbi:MAG: rhodanese-like domain-containing protein [Candidatus Binatia bacterium]